MSNEISIKLSLQTTEALRKMGQFVKESEAQLSIFSSSNRIALMEAEHSARAFADGLASGISPMRLLAMEGPRMLQAYSEATAEMQKKLLSWLPQLGAFAAVIGTMAFAWYEYAHAGDAATKQMEDLVKSLDKAPDALEKIHTLTKAGLLSPEAQVKYAEMLDPRVPYYKDEHGNLTKSPTRRITSPAGTAYANGVSYPTQAFDEDVPNAPATMDDRLAAAQKTMDAISEKQAGDLAKLNELKRKAHEQTMFQIDQEKAATNDKFDKERDELILVSQQSSALHTKGIQDALADIETARQSALSKIDSTAGDKATENFATARRKLAADALAIIEDQITAKQSQEGAVRGANSQKEYQLRVDAARLALAMGGITEDEFTHKVTEAAKQRAEGEKAYNSELEKQLQLKTALSRSDAEVQLRRIQANPFLTDAQKAQRSIPAISGLMGANASDIGTAQQIAGSTNDEAARQQALEKVNQLMVQQIDLQRQLTIAQNANNVGFQIRMASLSLVSSWGTVAQQIGNTFHSIIGGAMDSISKDLTGLILQTENWRRALDQIGIQILTTVINSIIQMGEKWIATQIIMAVEGQGIATAQTGVLAGIAAAQSAILATPATLATIASYGEAAITAPGLIDLASALTLASVAGRETGGPVSAGTPYIVGERRPELFVPTQNGYILPSVPSPMASIAGSFAGAGGNGTNLNVQNHFWDMERAMNNHIRDNPEASHIILSIVKKNAHVIGARS